MNYLRRPSGNGLYRRRPGGLQSTERPGLPGVLVSIDEGSRGTRLVLGEDVLALGVADTYSAFT